MSLNVTLVVVGGDVKTPEIKLRLPSTVGRGRDCTIMLRHPLVSRQHCEIFEVGGGLMVRDLGSLNGTFVNNLRIEGDAPLPPGQLLTIGTVTFRAMYDLNSVDSAPPTTPAPQMKTSKAVKPSNETDMDGTLAARPKSSHRKPVTEATVRNDDVPEEPVDVEMDFDLDDAKPLFSEVAEAKTAEDVGGKNGSAAKYSGKETVYASTKAKPPAAPVNKPAAPPKPTKPAEKPATEAKPAEAAPGFNFLAAEEEEETAKDEEDDDLNDFLKNLK